MGVWLFFSFLLKKPFIINSTKPIQKIKISLYLSKQRNFGSMKYLDVHQRDNEEKKQQSNLVILIPGFHVTLLITSVFESPNFLCMILL